MFLCLAVKYTNVLTSRSRGRYAKFGADTGRYQRRFDLQIPKRLASAPVSTRALPDTRPDTADTAAFSIWLLVVSICVSAVAYFTDGVIDL